MGGSASGDASFTRGELYENGVDSEAAHKTELKNHANVVGLRGKWDDTGEGRGVDLVAGSITVCGVPGGGFRQGIPAAASSGGARSGQNHSD